VARFVAPLLVARDTCGATLLGVVAWILVFHPASGLLLLAATLAVSDDPAALRALRLALTNPIPVPVGVLL
jgi:hypothetical protein